MKPATHFLKLLAIAAWPVGGLFSAPAQAGPATYDKETKSFRLTYTFANLAGAGIGDQVVGAAYKPTAEEEQLVNALVAQVSDVIFKATEGRGKIGRFDFVDDIKNADLVVSKTGKPASSGWATRSAIDNQPGYIVLYYQTLLPFIKQDVVYTGAHELSHYVFGLIDEYTPNLQGGCPARGGPGCLMDNYFSSVRGYMGRFCNSSDPHNASPAQQLSCQQIVDKFFSDRGVEKDTSALGAAATDPRDNLVETAIGKVKAKRLEDLAKKKPGASSGTGNLRTFAKKFFTGLIDDFNRNNDNKTIFTPDQINKAIDLIVRAGSVVSAAKPQGLTDTIFNRIKAQAEKLGKEVEHEKTESSRASKIRSQLTSFISGLVKSNVVKADDFPKDQQKELVDRLTQQAARSTQDKALDRLLGISDVNVQLNRDVASNIVDILDELGAPGIAARRAVLRQFDEDLKRFSIPGRTSATFGRRRTRFINPDPLDTDRFGYVLTQGGVLPYVLVRDRGFEDFSRLINRERIELVEPRFQTDLLSGAQPLNVRIERPFEGAQLANEERIRAERNTSFQALLNDLFDQLQRDRLENIAVLVPPGGLPQGLEQSLNVLRAKLTQGADVRLDVVLVGPIEIPPSLRDLSTRSRGSVLTVTDLDEVGAIAQRLKNEQTSGSWLIIPQPGTIPQLLTPAPGPLSDLISKAQTRSKALTQPLQTASDSLTGILTDDQRKEGDPKRVTLTQTERESVQKASSVVTQIQSLLSKLEDCVNKDHGKPSSVVTQIQSLLSKLEDCVNKDHGKRADTVPNVNVKLLTEDVVQLKLQVASAKSLIASARRLPPTNSATKRLFPLIDALEADKAMGREADKATGRGLLGGKGLLGLDILARDYEKILEAALEDSQDSVPIYQRIDRSELEKFRRQAEAQNNPRKPNPIDARTDDGPSSTRIRLARFYVERDAVGPDADLELIIGLSRPLPRVDKSKNLPQLELLDISKNPPQLELCDDGGAVVETTGPKPDSGFNLQFNSSVSTNLLLVYRVQAPRGLPEQGYTPFLLLGKDTADALKENPLNFTFSVGSTRRNVQLLAQLVHDLTDNNTRGTLRSTDRAAVVEVHVSAGSAVLNAKVVGFCQRILPGYEPIATEKVEFKDEGQIVRTALGDQKEIRDKTAGDGIYTASIPINGVTKGTEFRVFIQADTTDGQAHYIPLDDPNRGKPEKNNPSIRDDQVLAEKAQKSQAEAEGAVFKFQRSTSVHFRVEP